MTVPYLNFEKMVQFLQKAQELISNKAKEIVMKKASANAGNLVAENKQEMIKARERNKMNQERCAKADGFSEKKREKTPLPHIKSNLNSKKITTLRQKKMLYA